MMQHKVVRGMAAVVASCALVGLPSMVRAADSRGDARGMTGEERRIFERASALDTREDIVAAAEESLAERGYAAGPVDGVLDARTVGAVRDFQRDRGLSVTGRLDADTLGALQVGINMSKADPHPGAFTAGVESGRGDGASRVGGYPPAARPGSDRWLEQRALVRLIEAGIGPDVVVVSDNGALTLTGTVASSEARSRATDVAGEMRGVVSIDNQLTVSGAAASPAADASAQTGEVDATRLRPHPGGLIESRWVIGRPLLATDGSTIGRVSHVWFDPATGRVTELIVDTGQGGHRIVPWSTIDVKWRGQNLVLAVAKRAD